jgi:hypothetical protein
MEKELRDEEPLGSRCYPLSNAAVGPSNSRKLAALGLTIQPAHATLATW